MKKIYLAVCAAVLCLTAFALQPVFASPLTAPSAWELLAAVNALRAANGLPAFQTDAYLMAAAQGQADYLAAIGPDFSNGHAGPGGNTPDDRASAAGFPYVQGLDITECWAMTGPAGTLDYVIYTLWNDPDHMGVMLSSKGQLAVVGVAVSGSWTYYILDVANYFGAQPSHVQPVVVPGAPASSSGATPMVSQYVAPVKLAEPGADGSIIHEVLSGQSLWSIAIAYGVTIEELKSLNTISDATLLSIGQKLVIRAPGSANTAQPTSSPSPAVTQTLPTSIPTVVTLTAQPTLFSSTPTSVPQSAAAPSLGFSLLTVGLLALFAVGVVFIAVGFLLRR